MCEDEVKTIQIKGLRPDVTREMTGWPLMKGPNRRIFHSPASKCGEEWAYFVDRANHRMVRIGVEG